ncbi:MAG TPA: TonB C-terminal domain-containing protein [Polyangiaceae bacterium]|nr:TonB C-terminal domain-containing protein [Polyangiaceae bacterium]
MASTRAVSAERFGRAFEPREVLLSIAFSLGMLVALFLVLAFAGQGAAIKAAPPPQPEARSISVKPVLDEMPLLKLGGKKVRTKLPDMWKKQPPVQRFEAASAPSPKAAKTPDAIPKTPLVKPDAAAPPPDAEVAKEVDQVLLDAAPEPTPVAEGEGSPDGVKEGTEVDPLKARAVSQYLGKILGWFNARFRPPTGEIPCDELKTLSAAVAVRVGPDRRVAGYEITRPSGNTIFDERVRTTLERMVGEELPPPPPLYPDILQTTVTPRFSGSSAQCD